MLDKHTVQVTRSAVIRQLERSRPCNMSFTHFLGMVRNHAQLVKVMCSGIGFASAIVLLMYQNHELRRCKEDHEQQIREILDREAAMQLRHVEESLSHKANIAALRKRYLAKSLLAEGRRRVCNRKIRHMIKLIVFCNRYFVTMREKLQAAELARKSFATLAHNRFVLLEEAQQQLLPPVMQSTPPKLTLGSVRPKPNPANFNPPQDWKSISTSEFNYPLNIMIEGYKKVVRANNRADPANARPESSLMAECRFWEVKGVIPKSWLTMELPDEVATFFQDYTERPSRDKRHSAPSHSNGSKTHSHDDARCARNYSLDLSDVKVTNKSTKSTAEVKSSSQKGKEVVKPPPVIIPPPPKVVFLDIQKREQELKDTCSVVIADKSAKSAMDKARTRENSATLEFGSTMVAKSAL